MLYSPDCFVACWWDIAAEYTHYPLADILPCQCIWAHRAKSQQPVITERKGADEAAFARKKAMLLAKEVSYLKDKSSFSCNQLIAKNPQKTSKIGHI